MNLKKAKAVMSEQNFRSEYVQISDKFTNLILKKKIQKCGN